MADTQISLPIVIAGPIVRHVCENSFTVWLSTTQAISPELYFFDDAGDDNPQASNDKNKHKQLIEQHTYQLGKQCFIHTLIVNQDALFSDQTIIYYDIQISAEKQPEFKDAKWLSQLLPDLLYPEQDKFSVQYSKKLRNVIHGSCRKAHFTGKDALPQLDELIARSITNMGKRLNPNDKPATDSQQKATDANSLTQRPDMVLFTGDQVYIDDVAGPMICAIRQVIPLLGLFHEKFDGSTIQDSRELLDGKGSYYQREGLLPRTEANEALTKAFFKAKRKPIFTSVNASNHLIALNEMIALYLLSWSSRLWEHIQLDSTSVSPEYQERYNSEQAALGNFKEGLPAVERAFAHVPIYMIFDDHDVTDDWNLTRAWEEQVYGNPFSKRIVGNALIAYFLCQGMGNPKYTWQALQEKSENTFTESGIEDHDGFIDAVLEHDQWHYRLDTSPPIQVLDTRTQRWRSESNKNKPSGLMDWEALCDLQQDVIGQESVIMVSAAPIYGVKFIEAIQRVFITFGGALVVDAENWMAHRGTANVMLNIFRHMKTPPQFIILSGDVHYSFVYDVSLKFRRNSPNIIQFTCSGIHNEFPDKLIKWFERLNRFFYGHRSPLNWLTKRRNMSIKEREADKSKRDIINGTSLGLLELDENGQEQACKLILASGELVNFSKDDD